MSILNDQINCAEININRIKVLQVKEFINVHECNKFCKQNNVKTITPITIQNNIKYVVIYETLVSDSN